MAKNLNIDRDQEIKELIAMAKERVDDLLSDAEIEEVAQSVFEELLMRGEYSRRQPKYAHENFDDEERELEKKPRKRGRPKVNKAEQDRLQELEDEIHRLNQEKANAEKQLLRLRFEVFVDRLFRAGKLTLEIVERDDLVDYLEGLETGQLQLSEGESVTTFLLELLQALPSRSS